jgi:hypothetical protein
MRIPKMISQMWITLGFDVCWATAEVSAREGSVVCLSHHFIDVVVPS